ENSSPEALALLERAVQAQPGLAEAHHNLGVVLRLSGRLPEARSEFETALRLDARHPRTHEQLAFALASLGRLREAERYFALALELDPSDSVAREGLDELRRVVQSRQRPK
ncbi:MAG: tetratricopeptide repeat protein, partial [Verrucomicrobiales bacterium]|nr:tetratricopeptide repeat protein [Verrucomicrobiales bacterium]